MNFSRLTGRNRYDFKLAINTGMAPSGLLRWFSPWPQIVSTHTRTNQYSADYPGNLPPISGVLCVQPSLLRSSVRPARRWSPQTLGPLSPRGAELVQTHSLSFLCTAVAALHCLVSHVLKTVCFRYFLPFWWGEGVILGVRVNLVSVAPSCPVHSFKSCIFLQSVSLKTKQHSPGSLFFGLWLLSGDSLFQIYSCFISLCLHISK